MHESRKGLSAEQDTGQVVDLPAPRFQAALSVEGALRRRRSEREFRASPLALAEVSDLLWAAQGITSPDGRRTAPSAGALYPLVVYVVAGDVAGLSPGVYRYRPEGHHLIRTVAGDRRGELAAAALRQDWVAGAAVVIVVAAVYEVTSGKYGRRGQRYVHMEVGAAAQNVYLEAEALELATVFVGAFDDGRVGQCLGLPRGEQPLGLMPVGKRTRRR